MLYLNTLCGIINGNKDKKQRESIQCLQKKIKLKLKK